jgi:hypothetical protein
MIRTILAIATLVAPVAFGQRAQAQISSWCNGAVVADRFETRVEPGSQGRATYLVTLRSTRQESTRFIMQVTGNMLGRPLPTQMEIRGGAPMQVQLGFQPNMPGVVPMRGDQLAQATRISCF